MPEWQISLAQRHNNDQGICSTQFLLAICRKSQKLIHQRKKEKLKSAEQDFVVEVKHISNQEQSTN